MREWWCCTPCLPCGALTKAETMFLLEPGLTLARPHWLRAFLFYIWIGASTTVARSVPPCPECVSPVRCRRLLLPHRLSCTPVGGLHREQAASATWAKLPHSCLKLILTQRRLLLEQKAKKEQAVAKARENQLASASRACTFYIPLPEFWHAQRKISLN